ncbi:cell surface glycoprotein CD200 receptor 1-like isoform X1 [Girardinichthys multiradiatus]|uniref:cell surface glycoprotein CD200 receptor 1-like isoform X1 n=2 Tax=Girardinichthys multiradiatus TaxID=208333 RepID=UPI001FABB83E|nr:cell surface glycoprotein CD200 receptor 1-like isoform X1 [Girardinichthys multiradiatus]
MMRIYILIFFLTVSWSSTKGTNSTTSVISNTTTPNVKVYVTKKAVFSLGSNVDLYCSNMTWTEIMFVIWNIELKHKTCRISFSDKDQSIDSCNDGKSLRNTSAGQSYLHIPNFSADEVGDYRCESVYHGGNEYYTFEVAVTAPPKVSAWLERRDNKMVAVCRAEKGNPAANISWSPAGNGSVTLQDEPDGFVTVESWLELSGDMDPENLTCVVHHQFWAKEKTLVPKLKEGFRFWMLISVIGGIIVLLAVFSAFAIKKDIFSRQCQQAETPSKSPPTEDVEEVEPYASYVQRVNSIYN